MTWNGRKPMYLLPIEAVPTFTRPSFGTVALYRLYDRSMTRLLYVGITGHNRLWERIYQHKRKKDWFPEVGWLSYVQEPDEVKALREERHAIFFERPEHNKRSAGVKELNSW